MSVEKPCERCGGDAPHGLKWGAVFDKKGKRLCKGCGEALYKWIYESTHRTVDGKK